MVIEYILKIKHNLPASTFLSPLVVEYTIKSDVNIKICLPPQSVVPWLLSTVHVYIIKSDLNICGAFLWGDLDQDQ